MATAPIAHVSRQTLSVLVRLGDPCARVDYMSEQGRHQMALPGLPKHSSHGRGWLCSRRTLPVWTVKRTGTRHKISGFFTAVDDPKLPSVRSCRCCAAIAGRLDVRSADTMHGLQQLFHNPLTRHILANQILLTATLVGFDHFEAIEGASHGSCIAINAVKIAQDEDIHLGSEETRNGLFRPSDDRFLFVEACV
jgi:hypothetical protein